MSDSKQIILEKAQELFIAKNYEDVSLKTIAEKTGVSDVTIISYFKSKELLYDKVFENVMFLLSYKINSRLSIQIAIEENIKSIINTCIDIFANDPKLPLFLFSYIHKYPQKTTSSLNLCNSLYTSEIVQKQLWDEFGKGNIFLKDSDHFFLNLFSLIVYPFAIHQIINRNRNFNAKTFKKFMLQRKEIIFDMIISSIKK